MNQVVARFQDGKTLKGLTNDFLPTKDVFHVALAETASNAKPLEVKVAELKALCFVRSLGGDPQHHKTNEFPPFASAAGRKVEVTFRDGEVMLGTTQGYQPSRPGFFVVPADPLSNNERCYVVATSVKSVRCL